MKFIWLLFICIIVYCYGVSEDYYFAIQEPELANKTNYTKVPNTLKNVLLTARRTDSNDSSKTAIQNNNELDYESYNELSEIEDQMMNRTSKSKAHIGHNGFDNDSVGVRFSTYVNLHQGVDFVSKLKSFEEIIKDYAYHDDVTGTVPMLRDLNKSTAAQTEYDFNKVILKNATRDKNKSETLAVDVNNVIPVSSTINDGNEYIRSSNVLNRDIWYVPEKTPCWDLPILYGELGQISHTSKVFVMYPGILNNVIEASEKSSKPSGHIYVSISQIANKWCSEGPCYGDHTMCLFSDKINSKLCKNGYKVSTPTTVEQIGLVNTVNSMRNRIASGDSDKYNHLPTAADMNQLIYDFDLESMARAWLHQCLPGPAVCSALEGNYVTQLECTKFAKYCCINSFKTDRVSKCIPQFDCYINPIIGCIHVWFLKAGKALTATDVKCGRITPETFETAQLLWAQTNKIGCAYGTNSDGDIRVVCNFAPGASFYIDTKFYCGFTTHFGAKPHFKQKIIDDKFLKTLGIFLTPINKSNIIETKSTNDLANLSMRFSHRDILSKIYKSKWIRENLNESINGTVGMIARLVTKYTFVQDIGSQCDINEAIYESGGPGSKCVEKGRRFHALCYDFRDPTPGYRLAAVVAPVALFSLILYDLFSSVVRQTNLY